LAEPAEENHFFTFRHARQRRIPFVFKDLDIIAPDFLGKVLSTSRGGRRADLGGRLRD